MRVMCFSVRGARIAAGVFAVATLVSAAGVGVVNAAPRVISQPGTQEKKQQQSQQAAPAAPVQRQVAPQAVQSQPVQQVEVVRWIPGAPQAVQPIVVQNVVKEEVIVYETSPGLALASAAGSQVLTPQNVASTFHANIRDEDRGTLEAAGGAIAVGAVTGATVGAVGGATAGGTAGAIGGAAGGAALCGAAGAALVVAPVTAPVTGTIFGTCTTAGPVGIGMATGGAAGATAGAMVGAPAGALVGAQAGASVVPGGRAALDRTIADTTWDLEDQARVSQGAEPLRGEKPGDSMQSGPEAAASQSVLPVVPVAPAVPVVPVDSGAPSVLPASVPVVVPQVDVSEVVLDVPLPQVPAVSVPGSPFAAV